MHRSQLHLSTGLPVCRSLNFGRSGGASCSSGPGRPEYSIRGTHHWQLGPGWAGPPQDYDHSDRLL